MSMIDNSMKLGRELFEINTHVARRMTEITGDAFRQTFETNQDFAKRLTEVRDISTFLQLQREYGESLYNGASERLQTRGEVLKEAAERGSEAMRLAMRPAAAETASNGETANA